MPIDNGEALVFTLAAPLASFGDVAGNERRGGADRPAKSAVLGLVGAALGLDRDDTAAQHALATGYGFASRVQRAGKPMLDYHTVQALPDRKGRTPRTRAEALAYRDDLVTVITRREYVCDTIFDACLWARAGARWSLSTIADALLHPHHVLSFGRKSCPLMLPLDPRIVAATDAAVAFSAADAPGNARSSNVVRFREATRTAGRPGAIALDRDGEPLGANASLRVRRRDVPRDRSRWQFALRDETILSAPELEP